MTMVNYRQPLLSYAELTLPLPASEPLWLAPSAAVWKARIMSGTLPSFRPSMRSILQDADSISCLHAGFDPRVARSAYTHGLASQIWEHRQQTVLLHEMSDPSSQLWSRSRQKRLQDCLRNVEMGLNSSSALTCVLQQFLQMYLHADLDTITRFAGRCGEEAAHRAYIALQPWCKSREARTAIGTYQISFLSWKCPLTASQPMLARSYILHAQFNLIKIAVKTLSSYIIRLWSSGLIV